MSLLTLLTLARISTVRACARNADNRTTCQKCKAARFGQPTLPYKRHGSMGFKPS
jgi:hypothetical protein